MQSYVIDAFTLHAASGTYFISIPQTYGILILVDYPLALAAVTCLRSLAGFGFPLFAPSMYNALGYGGGSSLLAGFAIVVGCPAPWLFWTYGERIRHGSRYAGSPMS